MCNYYLAIDIGASSGRHILGHLENGKLQFEEIHRFENGMKDKDGELCWDLTELFSQIKQGMKKCKEIGKIPLSVGIDTWAVDFVLLDGEDKVIGNSVAYRDRRTVGMDEKVAAVLSEQKLYERTGIQKQIFNSVYQLMAIKEKQPENLEKAEHFLMIPDYFNFLLTGRKACEYTNATTTQLVSPFTKDWDKELITMLGLPIKIFTDILEAGSYLGGLRPELREEIGYDCRVVLPATHDTGSAVLAVPGTGDKPLYISSGTWSLLGTELSRANCSDISRSLNFTNEGGYEYRFRYLKNIMGLWMIQRVRDEIGREYSFAKISELASKETITSIVDCNDNRFLAPDNMTLEIKNYCRETNQRVPEGLGELATVIYNSLARCYQKAINELEQVLNISWDCIHIVGGGANADFLNRLTAYYTKKAVYAGPTEATAIGNIMVQMISAHELTSLADARQCISRSIELKEFR